MGIKTIKHYDDLINKFLNSYIPEPNSGCWLWVDYVNTYGYGIIYFSKEFSFERLAHRISYEYFKGEIPKEMHVCHKCDVRSCVNPDHLWLGTNLQNIQDMNQKGRATGPKGNRHGYYTKPEKMQRGVRNGKTSLTEAQVLAIFEDKRSGAKIAKEFPISRRQVIAIKNGECWKELLQRYGKI